MASSPQGLDRHRLLAEYSCDVVYIADPDGVVVWVSPAVHRVLGWTQEAIVGRPIRDLVHPDDAASAQTWRAGLVGTDADGDGPGSATDPLRFRRADGSYAWCTVSATRAYDDEGRLIGITAGLHDVDDLVRARQQASDERSLLHAVLDALIDPHVTLVAVRDEGGIVVDFVYEDANQPAASFHQMTAGRMIGATVLEVLTPSIGAPDVLAAAEVLESGQAMVWNDMWSQVRERQGRTSTWLDIRIVPVDGERVSYSWRDVSERHHAEQALARAHDLLRSVIDAQVDPHVILRAVPDPDGVIADFVYEDVNEAAALFEGMPREEIVGSTIRRVYRTDVEADEDVADCVQALATGRPVARNDSRTLGYLDPEGRPAFVDIRIVPIGADRVSYTWRDMTERHLAQERLAESEERFRLLAQNMSDVVGLVAGGRTTWISPSVSRALGWSPSDLIGQDPLTLVHEEDRAALGRAWADLQGGLVPRRRFRLRGADGRYRWVDVEGSAIPGEPGDPPAYVLSTRIVDAEVAALTAIQDQARHDELTGLVNRHAVFDQLGRSLAGAARTGSRVAMVFCDLDGFKAVNDEFGHSAGDALLRAISRRLERAVRSGDVVARIGGDELLVILNGVHDLDGAVHIAEKLRETVGQPTPVAEGTVRVSASIGVTLAEEGETVDQIVARADAAMYEAKRRGKDTVVSFGPGGGG